MIQVYMNNFKYISQAIYNNIVFSLPLHLMECSCGCKGCLIYYGFYSRSVKHNGEKVPLSIQRVKCKECGRTHAILPSFIVPYSQVLLADQQLILLEFFRYGKAPTVPDRNPLIDESNVRYILRQFRKLWEGRLESLALTLADHLILPCFRRWSMQFMQIRHTPNVLYNANIG